MNEYLSMLSGVLGPIVQVLRGNGVDAKILFPATIAVMIVGIWLSGAPDQGLKELAKEGLIWILGTVGSMFGTAYLAYKYAAGGKNPEERTERASSPMVPVTDANKTIVK